jgi:hypothetical protein
MKLFNLSKNFYIFLAICLFEFIYSLSNYNRIKNNKNTETKTKVIIASIFSMNNYLKSKSFSLLDKNTKIELEIKKNNKENKINDNKNKEQIQNFLEAKKNKISKKETIKENNRILMQGWLKYLEMNESEKEVPSNFYVNKVFDLQISDNPGINTQAKDNIGYINIPNEQFYFFELSNNYLKIYTSRPGKYRNFKEQLNIKDIIPLSNTYPSKGGIEDVGSFAEGFCFLVKSIKYSKHFIWELCAENMIEKNNWLKYFTKILTGNSVNNINSVVSSPVISAGPGIINLPSPLAQGFVNIGLHSNPLAISPPVVLSNTNPYPYPYYPSYQTQTGTVSAVPVNPHISSIIPGTNVAGVLSPSDPPLPVGLGVIIPAGYSVFENWSPCNKPCDSGVQVRILDCVDLSICMGRKMEERLCNIKKCKEDIDSNFENLKKVSQGQWEYLGTWTKCSKSCGGGIRTIQRKCLGGNCNGETFISEDCNNTVCQTLTGTDPSNMQISVFEREAFDECKLIEGNLMLTINNHRVLSHVEVNTQEIQVIRQDDPLHPITIPLAKLLGINIANKSPGCMEMRGINNQPLLLCPDGIKGK